MAWFRQIVADVQTFLFARRLMKEWRDNLDE
jgi:hypothetical protein